ncbi:hypothetical protein E4T39_08459 [Aureobasidium subglaciale]|nr:hypothetical protein E4T39_08459 [Aureobasidium subglaciale]
MPSQRQAIHAPSAPRPNGNYSHVVPGWMGDDPTTGDIVPGGVEAQTHRAILNISACLDAANSSLDKVVRRRIYLLDIKDFRRVDAVWAEYFDAPFPVSGLAKEGARVELEVTAEA